ncbi:hypothetical protein P280DRAFT_145061 [Massarina eburnea CBS 473.64]|uniref:Uncharacterized protein n=1 Tax=Massarina eburnea CBS 473.64 TaxID=1395130 RepID=A0A6A6RNS5_9PLEO|nr:hypothetical protein P280DRAFT_145061 [Massarina eburnea CBS 473.64]
MKTLLPVVVHPGPAVLFRLPHACRSRVWHSSCVYVCMYRGFARWSPDTTPDIDNHLVIRVTRPRPARTSSFSSERRPSALV